MLDVVDDVVDDAIELSLTEETLVIYSLWETLLKKGTMEDKVKKDITVKQYSRILHIVSVICELVRLTI
jgi:hypothetical protein